MSEEPKKIPSGITGTGFGAVNEKTVSKEGSQASRDKDRRSSSISKSSSSFAGSNQEDNKQNDIILEVLRYLPTGSENKM
jgi:hypothetical protein